MVMLLIEREESWVRFKRLNANLIKLIFKIFLRLRKERLLKMRR